ncbi:alpha-amylase family protein [Shewanella mesophila]|uniref:alpha-amylase family protein n=1 Tax=Shewanella mesophila TaxID=2864208 RepID=UPI001C6606AD|nr:alpha-amylase family protein [Shewanella mesophila]QYJ84589.1 alpha-amylase family protein [Shewanella mesophila]
MTHHRFTPLIALAAIAGAWLPFSLNAASKSAPTQALAPSADMTTEKPVIYQVFTRLFGNTNTTNKPWGTIADNGVGKFSDFTPLALESIHALGVSHIWYTGVPHHAVVNDYRNIGITLDDPDVVKGRAGSPYAVKDYYNVNPDLADKPANRLAEFEALIARTHQAGMKVIIDIVPNHVARNYHSLSNPKGVIDFGRQDNTALEYDKNNNFYYVVDTPFSVPDLQQPPLGGQPHPLVDGQFVESPAKWTGNGSRLAKPDANDWYETVKINYGVKPDGTFDFPHLPKGFDTKTAAEHFTFWNNISESEIPDSWKKFNQIAQYWLAKGVDGFRYDMAEMVPVEFWSYLNSQIKHVNPNALLLAEVYTPSRYRDYIHLGKMDYLYDKVGLYDTLKAIIQGQQSTSAIETDRLNVVDIASHMLHFLENHDEQRIASPEFASDPIKALPAMVVSTTLSNAPTLVYFGQEVGEDGSENAGFGQPSRTSIFDYVGVPAHQRYMNHGKFDGAMSSEEELKLRDFYAKLLNLSHQAPALLGEYTPLDDFNRQLTTSIEDKGDPKRYSQGYDDQTFAFARYSLQQKLVIVTNFSSEQAKILNLALPKPLIDKWQLKVGQYQMTDLLTDRVIKARLKVDQTNTHIALELAPLESLILQVEPE